MGNGKGGGGVQRWIDTRVLFSPRKSIGTEWKETSPLLFNQFPNQKIENDGDHEERMRITAHLTSTNPVGILAVMPPPKSLVCLEASAMVYQTGCHVLFSCW